MDFKVGGGNAKSYVLSRANGTSKWTHMVTVHASQTKWHRELAIGLMHFVQGQPDASKKDMVRLRDLNIAELKN